MNAIGAWVASLTIIPALAGLWDRWYYGRDEDFGEGCELPYRWLCWGTCLAIGNPHYDQRYFLLRLPSWDWQPDYRYRRHQLALYQRTIFMFAGQWSIRKMPAL